MVQKIKLPKVAKLKLLDKGIRQDVDIKLQEFSSRINKLAVQIGTDLAKMEDRALATWEYLHSVIEIMRDNGLLTDEILEEKRHSLIEKWRADKLADVKSRIKFPQVICEECFSLLHDETGELKQCPKCKQEKLFHAPKEDPTAPVTPPTPAPPDVEEKAVVAP